MDTVAGAFGQPGFDLGMFVRRVIVDNQMYIKLSEHVVLHVAEKGKEFLVPMASFALPDDRAGGDIECGKRVVAPWRT